METRVESSTAESGEVKGVTHYEIKPHLFYGRRNGKADRRKVHTFIMRERRSGVHDRRMRHGK